MLYQHGLATLCTCFMQDLLQVPICLLHCNFVSMYLLRKRLDVGQSEKGEILLKEGEKEQWRK